MENKENIAMISCAVLKNPEQTTAENLKDMDSDPQKTPVSEQIQALRPILQELAMKYKMPVEDAFIKYMDLASEAAVERDRLFKEQFVEE